VFDLQRDQKPRLGSMQRPQHPQSQGGPLGGHGPSRLQPQGSDRSQSQPHNPFAGLQSQGGNRQPQGSDRQQQQQPGLSNFQQHQIQQAYNNLMQQKQHPPSDEANPHHMSESSYPVQPVPSRAGPNNMLSLPSYRILPSLTSNDLDTIMKLRQQLSGENGLLTRLSSFMQAQRSTDQRTMAGIATLLSPHPFLETHLTTPLLSALLSPYILQFATAAGLSADYQSLMSMMQA